MVRTVSARHLRDVYDGRLPGELYGWAEPGKGYGHQAGDLHQTADSAEEGVKDDLRDKQEEG